MFKPDDIVVLGPNGVQYSKYIRDRVRLLAGRRIKEIMDFETNRSYFSYLDNHDNVKVYKLADFRYDFGITQPKASLIIIRHAIEEEEEEEERREKTTKNADDEEEKRRERRREKKRRREKRRREKKRRKKRGRIRDEEWQTKK